MLTRNYGTEVIRVNTYVVHHSANVCVIMYVQAYVIVGLPTKYYYWRRMMRELIDAVTLLIRACGWYWLSVLAIWLFIQSLWEG